MKKSSIFTQRETTKLYIYYITYIDTQKIKTKEYGNNTI